MQTTIEIGIQTYLPDVEWDGHHGVEDDDVTPEGEEPSVGRCLVLAIEQIPGFTADVLVPERVPDRQAGTDQDQHHKDLRSTKTTASKLSYHWWHAIRIQRKGFQGKGLITLTSECKELSRH